MTSGTELWTVVAEFRGTTWVTQVKADGIVEAAVVWAALLRNERPFGRASRFLAQSIQRRTPNDPPAAVNGLHGVWVATAVCGGDLMLANIVLSGPSRE